MTQLELGLALNRIGMKVDDDTYNLIKDDLTQVENGILELIDERDMYKREYNKKG